MFYIDSKTNMITLTRGDSAFITITLDTSGIDLRPEDIVRCQVRKVPSGGFMYFKGEIDRTDGIVWHIRPEDTRKMRPGDYFYDIEVEIADSGDVFTVIPVSTFRVLDEVTQGVV